MTESFEKTLAEQLKDLSFKLEFIEVKETIRRESLVSTNHIKANLIKGKQERLRRVQN